MSSRLVGSLRGRLALLFAVLIVVLAIEAGFGTKAFIDLLDGRRQVIDRTTPALVATERLRTAMVNQETGVRGYALAGERAFLQPYTQGAIDERRQATVLRSLTRHLPGTTGLLTSALARADEWTTQVARPTVALVAAGGPRTETVSRLRAGKRRFDAFRAATTKLANRLETLRVQARSQLEADTTRLETTILVGLAAVLIVGLVLWFALRSWIVRPLDRLGGAADEVTGALGREIPVEGPREVALLGARMEDMRARIVAELAEVSAARAELAERAEELRRSNAELEQFAYVASHDLQEPLRKVSGFTTMLQRRYAGQLDERADQYIGFAVDGAVRMQQLINDLLAFSRVGRTTDRFTAVDLDLKLDRALAVLESRRQEAGATIVRETPLPTVLGDSALLEAVFQNLIGNALKFHRPGVAPEIRVACREVGDEWSISVSDDGIGVEPAYAERVFVIFQRLHSKEAYEGTGIGLAMCRKIIEFHGGKIAVESNDGPGTTVRFTLPRQ